MTQTGGPSDLAALRELVRVELARAVRAAGIAERHERLTTTARETARPFHERMASTHRSSERRHRASAAMHAYYADRLQLWSATDVRDLTDAPTFISAVAEVTGSPSAAVTLITPESALGRGVTVAAASDEVAEAAADLEMVLGEGPTYAILSGTPHATCRADELSRCWPLYGPAVAELGIRSVRTARLGPESAPLGAVTAFSREPDGGDGAALQSVAEALTATALEPADRPDPDELPAHPLFAELDLRAAVHQAAGMVMVTHGCGFADALALLRAHAFALDRPLTWVALAVVERTLTLS